MKLSYGQLRKILKVLSKKCGTDIQKMWADGKVSVNELLDLILEKDLDLELLSILCPQNEEIEDLEGFKVIEILTDFFTYIVSNLSKLSNLLANSGLKAPVKKTTNTPLKN